MSFALGADGKVVTHRHAPAKVADAPTDEASGA